MTLTYKRLGNDNLDLKKQEQANFIHVLNEVYQTLNDDGVDAFKAKLDSFTGSTSIGQNLCAIISNTPAAWVTWWDTAIQTGAVPLSHQYLWGVFFMRFAAKYNSRVTDYRKTLAETWSARLSNERLRAACIKQIVGIANSATIVIGNSGPFGVCLVLKDALDLMGEDETYEKWMAIFEDSGEPNAELINFYFRHPADPSIRSAPLSEDTPTMKLGN